MIPDSTPEVPADLIGLSEAAQMIPSKKPGKRLNIAVLRRWCIAGRVEGARRINGYWFVPREWVHRHLQGEPPPARLTAHRKATTPEWAKDILRQHGLLRD